MDTKQKVTTGNTSTLHLNLKRFWFDMILSGKKKEEYRAFKQFWVRRFITDDFSYSKRHPLATTTTSTKIIWQ